MAGVPGRSGGTRPGSGRKNKTREERLEPTREHLDERLQENIDSRLNTLEQLAAGGLQTVTERWELAGAILIDSSQDVLDRDGAPTGKTVTRRVRALPDKPADELVLVSRTVKTLAPSLAANIYLVNRLVGTPTPTEEPVDENAMETLPEEIEAAIVRIYGVSDTQL